MVRRGRAPVRRGRAVVRRGRGPVAARRRTLARARRGPGRVAAPQDRVLDRAVPRAAAQVALEVARQVLALRVVERRGGHDHPGGAEPALEALRVEELLLHRVQRVLRAVGVVVARARRLVPGGTARARRRREPLDRRHLVARRAPRGVDARVHRDAVDVHGARAAVAAVAPLLHAERALLAQVGAQALARAGLGAGRAAVDRHRRGRVRGGRRRHRRPPSEVVPSTSSARICSPRR